MEPTIAELVLGRTLFGISMGDIGRYGLMFIMLTMGMTLQVKDFTLLLKNPGSVLAGLIAQMLLLPIVAFVLIWLLQPPLYIAVGAIVLACCPGAATSNYFCYLARGDVALSVTLTAISGMLVLLTMPVFVNAGFIMLTDAEQAIRLPVLQTMQQIFLMLILPVVIGMSLRAILAEPLAKKIQTGLSMLSFGLMMLVVVMSLSGLQGHFVELIVSCGLLALITNLITMFCGFGIGSLMGLADKQCRALTVEVGIQNFLLAMIIALTILKNPEYAIFPVVYLVMMYITVFAYIAYCRWLDSKNVIKF